MNITGTLSHFNFSPKGSYEALIIATAKGTVQVNFEPHQAHALAATLKPGSKITLKADPLHIHDEAAHPLFELKSVQSRGKTLDLAQRIEVKGKVQQLNYALHGEANGAVLDSGDFVHLRPHGARAVGLTLGQPLRASGQARPLLFGPHRVIEADTANGINLDGAKHAKKAAKKAAKKGAKKTAKKAAKK